ncbi:MAG: HEPN domain-containing protein [Oscillospiraceae bacterium]|nr:HEPN domain-containing protein [Oscillospiraceae bacterium]
MADSVNYKDWYFKASKDLEWAHHIIFIEEEADVPDFSGAAFHSQQCIEKYLKGYILKETGELFEGHNLSFLCKRASRIDVTFRNYVDGCDFVNKFYIQPRYPADIVIINRYDGEECVKIAKEISEYIVSLDC